MTNWKTKKAVESAVDKLAQMPLVQKFYPTYISKITGCPLKELLPILMSFVEDGRLILEWEIRCPNYDCSRTLKTISSKEILTQKEILNCLCGEEVPVTTDNLFPVFSFTKDYREGLIDFKDSKKNKIPRPLNMNQAV